LSCLSISVSDGSIEEVVDGEENLVRKKTPKPMITAAPSATTRPIVENPAEISLFIG
jgi:hypothetical protein